MWCLKKICVVLGVLCLQYVGVEGALTISLAGAKSTETDAAGGREQEQQGTLSGSTLYYPDYVVGGGWSVQLVLSNDDASQPVSVVVDVYDQQGRSQPTFFGSSGNTFEIPGQGSRVLSNTRASRIQRGWIEVRSPRSTVRGLLTYRQVETGLEVGVESVPLSDHFALFIEETSDIGTGLAILNPDASPQIEFRLRDSAGNDPLGEVLTRGDFKQQARTIPEWLEGIDQTVLRDFRGLLFLRATDGSDFAPLGLRFGKQKVSLSAVPVMPVPDLDQGSDRIPNADPVQPTGPSLIYPDYVVGGGWSVQLVLCNIDAARTVSVVVDVYDQQGRSQPTFFGTPGNTFEIPAQGSRVLSNTGASRIQRGWIEVRDPRSTVRGLLTYRQVETGIEVGVEAVPPRDHFSLFVEETSDIGTGLAIFKPDASPQIEFRLRDSAGNDPLGETLTRGGFKQQARTIPEWLEGIDQAVLRDFRGLLFLRASDGSDFAPLGLRFGKRKVSLSAVPAIPVPDSNRDKDGGGNIGGGKLYWTDFVPQTDGEGVPGAGKIRRANLDGSEVDDLVRRLTSPLGLALHRGEDKLYWTDFEVDAELGQGKIQRANLDGSDVEDVITELNAPYSIALDPAGDMLYWLDFTDDIQFVIQRAKIGSSQVNDLVTADYGVVYIHLSLDPVGGKLYWTEALSGRIQRANLDGSDVEDVITELNEPHYLALDPVGGKLYWTEALSGRIQRANLDDPQVEVLLTGSGTIGPLALDVGRDKIYWAVATSERTGKIQRANLDGSQVEDLVASESSLPAYLVLDLGN